MTWITELRYLIHRKNRWGGYCVLHYRIAHWFSKGWRIYIGFPFIIYYHILFRHILSFDVHEKTEIGKYFCPWHCYGIAINPTVQIGSYFTIGQNSTLGKGKNGGAPLIGNNVTISAGCNVIGPITVGDNAIIGIGSVVVKDVPANSVVAGNPASIVRFLN